MLLHGAGDHARDVDVDVSITPRPSGHPNATGIPFQRRYRDRPSARSDHRVKRAAPAGRRARSTKGLQLPRECAGHRWISLQRKLAPYTSSQTVKCTPGVQLNALFITSCQRSLTKRLRMTSLSDVAVRHSGGGSVATPGGPYELIAPHLTEKRRLLPAATARALARRWRGSAGCRARRCREVGCWRSGPTHGRIRRRGGGPKRLVERQPGLLQCGMSWCTLTSQGMPSPRPPPVDRPRSAPGPDPVAAAQE